MRVLALDCSTSVLSVALWDGQQIVAVFEETMLYGQAERLLPIIKNLLTQNKWTPLDIEAVTVTVGPGSFTGVRVGLATARALGLGLNIPVWGVTALEVLSAEKAEKNVAVIDTKRGDFYSQIFEKGIALEKATIRTKEAVQALNIPVLSVEGVDMPLWEKPANSLAVQGIQIALKRIENPLPATPFYLREADVTCSRQ